MWSANAATVAASRDCSDQKVHFTAANLVSKFHRSIEHLQTSRVLSKIFENPKYFVHHPALPSHLDFGDEGAANHTRFCTDYGSKGLHFFVYGRVAYQGQKTPNLFPARQTLEASQAVARLHQLDPEAIVFAQQNPEAIDAGVFHNDVVAVGNSSVLFCHEAAFLSQASVLEELKEKFKKMTGGKQLQIIQVAASQVSLQDAIDSYLFNTQLIEVPGKSKMLLIAPQECNEVVSVRQYLEDLLGSANCPIGEVQKFDLRQSMQNGGGPACLRLRVVLTDEELKNTHSKIMMNDSLFEELSPWVIKHYRDRLSLEDLADTQLMNENRTALDELTQILDLGSIYGFQTAV
jgi:succinylarginine dihydrolase